MPLVMRAALAQWDGRHGARILAIAFFIPAALLFAPILYYSLDTPFGLVDDYSDWKYSIIFTSPALFLDWIDFTFLGTDVQRYRPFWDFYNAAAWSVFGTTPWLHHLSRWVFHFAAILMFALAFLRFARPDGGDGGSRTWMLPLIPVAFLVYVWMFFPNSPASRLSPQEVYTVFFLGMCTLAVAWTLKSEGGKSWIRSGITKYGLFLLGYTGLVLSKEVNVAVALWLLLAYINYAFISRKRRIIAGALPFIFLFIFTIIRVSVASESYNSSFSSGSFTSHALFIARGIFQMETSLTVTVVFSVLFAASIACITLKRRFASDRPFVLFLLGQMISLYLIFSLSSQDITIRYWYPVLPSFILVLAFSVKYILIYFRGMSLVVSRIFASLIVIFTLLFVMINYYDFANQTLAQHSARKADETILAEISSLHATGNYVYSNPQIEQEDSLFFYFTEYFPFFSGAHYKVDWRGWPYVIDISFSSSDDRIHNGPPSDPEDPYFSIVHRQGNVIFDFLDTHAITSAKDDYMILSHARALAGFLQGKHPHVSVDHGALPVDPRWDGGYEWAIYRVPFGDPVDRINDSLRTTYEQAVSADPVARAAFDLYSSQGNLVYVRERCTPRDARDMTMYLHVTPADTASLPERMRALGFDNLDFPFGTRGASFDGRCVAVVQLPDYAIASIRTGQYPGEGEEWRVEFAPGASAGALRAAYEQAAGSTPVARSTFDLHVIENRLVYVRERCAAEDTDDWFFLHLTPDHTGDLPAERREYGFDSLDFRFALRGARFDGRCVASMPLPDYPIAGIRTGQYGDGGETWSVEFAPER